MEREKLTPYTTDIDQQYPKKRLSAIAVIICLIISNLCVIGLLYLAYIIF